MRKRAAAELIDDVARFALHITSCSSSSRRAVRSAVAVRPPVPRCGRSCDLHPQRPRRRPPARSTDEYCRARWQCDLRVREAKGCCYSSCSLLERSGVVRVGAAMIAQRAGRVSWRHDPPYEEETSGLRFANSLAGSRADYSALLLSFTASAST